MPFAAYVEDADADVDVDEATTPLRADTAVRYVGPAPEERVRRSRIEERSRLEK